MNLQEWGTLMMTIMGIDPGVSGGIALIDLDGVVKGYMKMPETLGDLATLFKEMKGKDIKCYLEKIGSMPGDKKFFTRIAKLHRHFGQLQMGISMAGIPFEEVVPKKWQTKLSCLTKGNKKVSKEKAQKLFPQCKVTHAVADALLIAEYGRRIENGN